MKNIILFIAVYIICITNVFAQSEIDSVKTKSNFCRFNTKEKVSYEIRAGINFPFMPIDVPASISFTDFTGKEMKLGYNIGLLVDMPFLENIYFQTGLFLSSKGVYANYLGYGDKEIKTAYCAEQPFLISYRQDINKQLKWDLNFGPYIECAWVNENWIAYGLVVGAGIHYNKLYFGIQYDLGLTNKESGTWWPNYDEHTHYRNNILSIVIGHRL